VDRPWRRPNWQQWRWRAVVLGVVASMLHVAVGNFFSMSYRAIGAEVPMNVDGLKTASLAYDAAFDTLVEVPVFPRPFSELDRSRHPVVLEGQLGTLGWSPDGEVRGAYRVLVREDGKDFLVVGAMDLDADGRPAVYSASKTFNAIRLAPNDVY